MFGVFNCFNQAAYLEAQRALGQKLYIRHMVRRQLFRWGMVPFGLEL